MIEATVVDIRHRFDPDVEDVVGTGHHPSRGVPGSGLRLVRAVTVGFGVVVQGGIVMFECRVGLRLGRGVAGRNCSDGAWQEA